MVHIVLVAVIAFVIGFAWGAGIMVMKYTNTKKICDAMDAALKSRDAARNVSTSRFLQIREEK